MGWRSLSAITVAVAALFVLVPRIAASRAEPSLESIAPVPIPAEGARVIYPAASQPVLTAPDGSRHRVASLLNVRQKMHFGDYVWDDAGVGPGPVWVQVDLANQLLSVFRNGHEIGSAVVLYGTDGKPTPSGVFPVMQKARDHRSSLYDAAMPFMLRLTGDGVAIHASDVRRGRATHGCIGVPPLFAEKLFAVVGRGDAVVVLPATRSTAT